MGKRRVCFVTGTRAEFGLMRSVLEALRRREGMSLQIIATGMHLDARHGKTVEAMAAAGYRPDAVVEWPAEDALSPSANAAHTGEAIAGLARATETLGSEIVLVVGDRVEALAGAVAGHLSHRVVAHVHGGDRAQGQVDDALRHAITKLSHLHFPATRKSAARIARMGEEGWRIHCAGSPGIDGIVEMAAGWEQVRARFEGLEARRYALMVLHPADADEAVEHRRAGNVLEAIGRVGVKRCVAVYPNNDPGCGGIVRRLEEAAGRGEALVCRDLPRGVFLGLMKESAVMVGNSSSGIIEAASFGVPVVDIGPRQEGRERSGNVAHCGYETKEIEAAVARAWNGGKPRRSRCRNVYGAGAGEKIAETLARVELGERLRRKLIAY